jgi:hypothetical protein
MAMLACINSTAQDAAEMVVKLTQYAALPCLETERF